MTNNGLFPSFSVPEDLFAYSQGEWVYILADGEDDVFVAYLLKSYDDRENGYDEVILPNKLMKPDLDTVPKKMTNSRIMFGKRSKDSFGCDERGNTIREIPRISESAPLRAYIDIINHLRRNMRSVEEELSLYRIQSVPDSQNGVVNTSGYDFLRSDQLLVSRPMGGLENTISKVPNPSFGVEVDIPKSVPQNLNRVYTLN